MMMAQTQKLLAEKGPGAVSFEEDDPALGDLNLGGVKAAQEMLSWKNSMEKQPKRFAASWMTQARLEAHVEDGMPFSAALYGDRCLQKAFEGHSTLERLWVMLAAIHQHSWAGRHDLALAQTTACLKATAEASRQGGVWRGAWEYTFLPDLRTSESGISLAERASVARLLREKAAVEKIVAEARAEKPS